jgi:RNA polymerase sigma-70 factor (ECF subfamily)
MLHCEARRSARRDADGYFVPLSEQDPQQWNDAMIDEAEQHLTAAAAFGRSGRFQIEAAIQSAHVEQTRSGIKDWKSIAWFYDRLVELSPTLGAMVARAAAAAEATGAETGLALLDSIEANSVAAYQPYWAVRAHILRKGGRGAEADKALDRAIVLTEDAAVRRFLADQRG